MVPRCIRSLAPFCWAQGPVGRVVPKCPARICRGEKMVRHGAPGVAEYWICLVDDAILTAPLQKEYWGMRPAARCRVEHHVLPDRDSLDAAVSLLFRNESGDRGTDGDPLPARRAGGHDICRHSAQCDAVTADETTTAGRAAAPAGAATRARRGAGGTMTPSFQHPPPPRCLACVFFLLVTPTGIDDDGSVRLSWAPGI